MTHSYQRGQAMLAIAIVLLIIVVCIFFAALAVGLGG